MKRFSCLLVVLVSACGSSDTLPFFEASSSTGSGGQPSGAAGNDSTTTGATTSAGTNGSMTGGGTDPAGSGGAATGGAAGSGGAGTTSAGGSALTGGGGASDASVGPDGGGGARPGDASLAKDAPTIDAGPVSCDAGTFPTFDNGCDSTDNCSIGLHQISCCGTLVAIGFNHAFHDAFDKAEAGWRLACPAACGCVAGPTRADDGQFGNAQNVAVKCESRGSGSSRCLTYFP